MARTSAGPANILVLGECGNGKSTLIGALRDPSASRSPTAGKDPSGVTKQIDIYPCRHPDGLAFNLIDTPGIGDHSVSPVALVSKLEAFLSGAHLAGGIHGVLVTAPVPDARVRYGAQVVQTIVDKGFVSGHGDDHYANVILVGTKSDKADDDDRQNFLHGIEGGKTVRDVFFAAARDPKRGRAVLVHRGDYGPLLEAIRGLPSRAVAFRAPERSALAGELAKRAGLVADLRDQVRQNEAAIQEAIKKMREAERRHQEEQARQAAEEARLERERREAQARAQREHEEAQRNFEQQHEEERRRHEEERRREEREREEERQRWAEKLGKQRRHTGHGRIPGKVKGWHFLGML